MYIADLHIHSKYSRATSANCLPEYLDLWARKKGISLLGTGDFTHPAWRKELEDKLQKVDEGVYALKKRISAGWRSSWREGAAVCSLRRNQLHL